MFYRLPANRFFVWLDKLFSFQFSKIESTWAMKELLDDKVLTLRFSAVETNTSEAIIAGGGGSAMPCGLVLPAASAQLELADLLPDVIPAALSY